MAEIGKLLGVNYIITGTVDGNTLKTPGHYEQGTSGPYWIDDSYSSGATLNLTMINVETGEVVFSSQTDGSDSGLIDALSWAVYNAVRNFYSAIPLRGCIIKIDGNHYYIDLGTDKNITVKDRFIVTQEGEPIVHPKTGKLIPQIRNVGTLEVVEVCDDMAIAVKMNDSKNAVISVGDNVTRKLKDKPGRFLGLIGSREHVY